MASRSWIPGWLAVARAFTEPELVQIKPLKDFLHNDQGTEGYVERLAFRLVNSTTASQLLSQVLLVSFSSIDCRKRAKVA